MKQILFVTYNRIGDAVLSSGVLSWLADRYPDAEITVACGPATATLFRDQPGVVRIIEMAKKKRSGHWFSLWKQTVGTNWDMVVDLRASLISYLLRSKSRHVLRQDTSLHRVPHIATVLGLTSPPPPRLATGAKSRETATGLVPDGTPVLAVGPTANWAGKAWPAERFIELIERLTAADGVLPNARIMIIGAAAERDAALPVINAFAADRVIDLVGKTDLPQTAACLERADFYVGNDSGPMHMAAAVGLPTLGLFGPSPEARYGPWGPKCASIRGARSFEDIISDPTYDFRSTKSEMTGLSVHDAYEAARALKAKIDAQTMNKSPKLSTLTVAHNEEHNLKACLEALSFADERVVVLDRCTDRSKDVALAAGADTIIEGAWPIEGDRRNAGIEACKGEWVLEVDADERVPADLAREIDAVTLASPSGYYLIQFDNYVGKTRVRYGWGAYIGASAAPRLFARGTKKWGRQRVHPALELGPRLGMLETRVDHLVDDNITDMLARFDRYTTGNARDLISSGKVEKETLRRNIRRIPSRFYKAYVRRKGYREGGYGFLVGILAGLYPVVSYLKATLEPEHYTDGNESDRK
ncbi:MAG: glycosyltransferase family 9 protein [Alphaproteobacteria bacterium]|nr:glycosyltransferase family 9 protein [Alphaproteobacteria bacterium]